MLSSDPSITDIENVFKAIQNHISEWLLNQCPTQQYREDRWDYAPKGKGGGITRVWEYDEMLQPTTSQRDILLEKGGVNFSSVEGPNLPKYNNICNMLNDHIQIVCG
jgi:coproporphyrinogen III oxidase